MSGIAGLVRTDEGPPDLALVWAIISALALRSPGGRQLLYKGAAALGHANFRTVGDFPDPLEI